MVIRREFKLSKEACEIFGYNSFINYRFVKKSFKKLTGFHISGSSQSL